MASIQSLGVGSGLLTSDLVEQIIDAERAPVEARLDNKQAIAEAKISAYGEITSALSSFDDVLQSLKLPSTFNASTVSSSNEASVTGTASSLAAEGNYTVDVSQLAQAHSIASGSYEELTSTVGTGVLNFQFERPPTARVAVMKVLNLTRMLPRRPILSLQETIP